MRKAIVSMMESDPQIKVIGTATNGREGYELAKKLKPKVMTLDIEMPEMDGLTALQKIMRDCPTQVIMVSSLTTEGSEASFKALKLGAADVLAKEQSQISLNITKIQKELLSRVKALAQQKVTKRGLTAPPDGPVTLTSTPAKSVHFRPDQFSMICIGSSTGGPPVLEQIFTALPDNFETPIVVAQHMPEVFTASLAERLSRMTGKSVVHAESGMHIERRMIYIARGGKNIHITCPKLGELRLAINDLPEGTIFKPSVNALFSSAAEHVGSKCLGVVLTGIGDDGLKGGTDLKKAGGTLLGQDEATSVVYGMPRAVAEAKLVRASLPPAKIAESISMLAYTASKRAG